jgi:hypothetical protein
MTNDPLTEDFFAHVDYELLNLPPERQLEELNKLKEEVDLEFDKRIEQLVSPVEREPELAGESRYGRKLRVGNYIVGK